MAKSRNLPGVTKSLQWVRIGGRELEGLQENALELLDSPGIIPARQLDQEGALKLAICNDIGEASYDRVVVAAALCDRVNDLHRRCGCPPLNSLHVTLSHTPKLSAGDSTLFRHGGTYVAMRRILERYGLPYNDLTGEQIVYDVADKFYQVRPPLSSYRSPLPLSLLPTRCQPHAHVATQPCPSSHLRRCRCLDAQGNLISAADKLLGDFRKGLVGWGSLEAPPSVARRRDDDASTSRRRGGHAEEVEEMLHVGDGEDDDEESALPPLTDGSAGARDVAAEKGSLDVGKGNYEGW
jgi:hypothetical protein